MQTVYRTCWLIMLAWAMIVAILVAAAPDMATLVREKGQINIPAGYPSSLAEEMEARHQTTAEDGMTLVLVFHNKDGLTAKDREEAAKAVQLLTSDKEALGVTEITSAEGNKELEAQLSSKDNKTTLALVHVNIQDREIADIRKSLEDTIRDVPVEHYYTGASLIDEDVIISSEKGLKRTEIITVAFILVVLILVFRSLVAPVIPLLTVGVTYIASQSIVAFLVDRWNFPLSNFTQIFLVAILFGIGTDYCILLLSRFKEELAKDPGDIRQAIFRTYATAGRTVFFSGLAAMVGFASIGFAAFKLYQSSAAVAIGVAVLLVALFTIVPFFMAVLGPRLFWPSKASMEHHESRLWEAAGRFSLRKPIRALLLVAVVAVPLLLSYKGNLSFNSLNEIGDGYDSVKGFNIVADSFGPGESMTTKVVVESGETMDNPEAFAAMESISRELLQAPGVAKVRSLTRPLGDPVEQFAVTSQAKALDDGIGKGSDGLETIRKGLSDAGKSLSASAPDLDKASDGLKELVDGTNRLGTGVTELKNGLTQIQEGITSGAAGAGELQAGIAELRRNAVLLAENGQNLLKGFQTLETGLNELSGHYASIESGLSQTTTSLQSLDSRFASLTGKYPGLRLDADYLTIQGTVEQTGSSLKVLATSLEKLNVELTKARNGLSQLNQGMEQTVSGQLALIDGLGKIESGSSSLRSGLEAAAEGQKKAVGNLPALQDGLGQMAEGQSSLLSGFSTMGGQLRQLTDGLDQSAGGLKQVQDGLTTARSYLKELSSSPDPDTAGWFLPKEAEQDPQFQQALNRYMSPDRKLAYFEIVLKDNPYSAEALASMEGIRTVAERALRGTVLEDAKLGIGGVSSIYADLDNISNKDYKRTVMLMLAGITLILIVLLRSLVMPLYLVGSLLMCYFMALAVNEVVFVHLMGYSGTNWTIPFFGFVILMALGVDYSIFLMDRFNEHKDEPVSQAILTAMKNMGTVIMSAVIILAGTFAAMFPSGVLSLLQIAAVTLSGLLMYAFLFLQFFIPVMVRVFGRANWWPFMPRNESKSVEAGETTAG